MGKTRDGFYDAKVECVYDYRSRRVEKRVSTSADAGQTWTVSQTRRFLYDGWLLIAEFDHQSEISNLKCTHLWGVDLSGTLEGAGGIGGLLRTRLHETIGTSDYYPTYDANGNVSAKKGTVLILVDLGHAFGESGRAVAKKGTVLILGSSVLDSRLLMRAPASLWFHAPPLLRPSDGSVGSDESDHGRRR